MYGLPGSATIGPRVEKNVRWNVVTYGLPFGGLGLTNPVASAKEERASFPSEMAGHVRNRHLTAAVVNQH